MSQVRDQTNWIRLCRRGELSDNQRVLLETVLAASDPKSILTRHAASSQTAVDSIARAHAALTSRARPDRRMSQPFSKPTFALISAALAVFESRKPAFPSGALDTAIRTLTDITAHGEAGLENPATCKQVAEHLAIHATEMRTTVADQFETAWTSTAAVDTLEHLALEIAALCVMMGRWHPLLMDDVRADLSRGSLEAHRMLDMLLPAERDFQVAVIVEGTSRLESVAGLMDTAVAPITLAPGEPITGWGRCTPDLKALADLAETMSAARRGWSGDQASGYLLLTFTTRACDLGHAALHGRRAVSELLDQYMAGQRVTEIRLRPETLTHDMSSGRMLRLSVPVMESGRVSPLTTSWPPALRESLRMAHVARMTEAPMTAAGLCWAALEALEVKPKDTGTLARALSLQALRHQIVDLHQMTRTAVAATVKATREDHSAAQANSARLTAAMTAVTGEKAADVKTKTTAARDTEFRQRTALQRALETEKNQAVVDNWTGVTDGTLRDPNRWLDVLPAPADPEPELHTAANALTFVAEQLNGEAGARLRTWHELLTAPQSLAKWIEDTERQFKSNLDWLYALRNTALHDGQFVSITDRLDVHTGRAFVDLTLEFLGNWYETASAAIPRRSAWTAFQVIEHLAQRQRTLLSDLLDGTEQRLDIAHLTSPTSTGRDRDVADESGE